MSRDGLVRIRGRAATIESSTETRNPDGELVATSWASVADVMALIQPLAGRELFAAQQRFAEVSHRIQVVPFVAGVTPKMRLNAGGTIYDILGAFDMNSRGAELELYAVQRGV